MSSITASHVSLDMHRTFIRIHIETFLKASLEYNLAQRNSLSTHITQYNQLFQTLSIIETQRKKAPNKPIESFMDIGEHHYVKVVIPEVHEGETEDRIPIAIDIGANTKVECQSFSEAKALVQRKIEILERDFRVVHEKAVAVREEIRQALGEYKALG